MATDKTKAEKEYTVEEKLKTLYDLQTILSEIDRIKTLRGELPLEVQDLEDEIAGLETRIKNFHTEIEDLKAAVSAKKVEIQNAQTLIEKYTKQQDNVRNNREFDFLSKEIEYQTLEIQLCEKRINEFIAAQEAKSNEVAASEEILQDRQHILNEKKSELDEIVSETKQDEEKLREKAKKLENKVEPRLLSAFKRIRKNARNGLAVVYIQRDSCGGCFNRIPPQRQLDIKMRKKIIVCEYCGRIMIDPELAGVQIEHKVEEAPATTTKRAIRRKTAE
ncbi:zinc ribbon domain-containing protein [Barnesiella intestinihominis]|uniref:zinc ribbon domain-containing protein n=3 Tax=Barnesiella intestinihominis TaxID=487174 RepID=UPI003AB1D426